MIPAVYLRVSTEEQVERQTIGAQREYAEHYLKLHGIGQAQFYEDLGISGTVPVENRPAGARLLRDVAAGRVKLVLVYRVDRLARSLLELLRFVDVLDRHGAALRSESEPFDTGSALGRAFLALLGTFAQLERDAIRERTMQGKDRAAREGRWHGGPAPYGYRLAESRLVPHPEEAEIIREIFTLCLAGHAAPTIANLLNARGLPNPTRAKASGHRNGGRWARSTVQHLLHQPAYYGEAEFRRGIIPCPPLVSRETWDAAQQALRDRRDLSTQEIARLYPLRGLVRCALCGDACCGTSVTSRGRRFFYYHCTRQGRDRHGGETCRAPHFGAEKLERLVWERCRNLLLHPEVAAEELRTRLEKQAHAAPALETEAQELERLLTEKTEERARVLSLARRGFVTEAEAGAELGHVATEMLALQERLRVIQERQFNRQAVDTQVTALMATLGQLASLAESEDPHDWQRVFRALVVGIELGPGRDEVRLKTLLD